MIDRFSNRMKSKDLEVNIWSSYVSCNQIIHNNLHEFTQVEKLEMRVVILNQYTQQYFGVFICVSTGN